MCLNAPRGMTPIRLLFFFETVYPADQNRIFFNIFRIFFLKKISKNPEKI